MLSALILHQRLCTLLCHLAISERAGLRLDLLETLIPRSKAAVSPYDAGGDLTPLRYVVDRLVLEKCFL